MLVYRAHDPRTCLGAWHTRDVGIDALFLVLDPVTLALGPGTRLQLCFRLQPPGAGRHRRLLRARVARWAEDGVALVLDEDDGAVRDLLEAVIGGGMQAAPPPGAGPGSG